MLPAAAAGGAGAGPGRPPPGVGGGEPGEPPPGEGGPGEPPPWRSVPLPAGRAGGRAGRGCPRVGQGLRCPRGGWGGGVGNGVLPWKSSFLREGNKNVRFGKGYVVPFAIASVMPGVWGVGGFGVNYNASGILGRAPSLSPGMYTAHVTNYHFSHSQFLSFFFFLVVI